MASDPPTSGPDNWLILAWDHFVSGVNYTPTLIIAHTFQHILSAAIGASIALAVSRFFTKEVKSEAIVESTTDYHPSGEINPETDKEYINQVIDTKSTFRLTDVFAEATLDPQLLIRILKKAATYCDEDNPIVWSHLHKAMQRESPLFDWIPERVAKMFGHYSEEQRRIFVNEIARCYRNFLTERLKERGIDVEVELDRSKRERPEYAIYKTALIFQEGAGADVFTLLDLTDAKQSDVNNIHWLLDYDLPDEDNTQFIYDDYDKPVRDPKSHLHQRVSAIRSIQQLFNEDADEENSLLGKFFVRYKTGKIITAPGPNSSVA